MPAPDDPADLLRRQLQALREAGAVEAHLSPDGALLRVTLGPLLPAPRDPESGQRSPIPQPPGASVGVRAR